MDRSAPTQQTAHKGLEDRQLKLGCVKPGESVATFGDALRRLADGATYLYVDGHRYWYSTQPSVNRLANDRADVRTTGSGTPSCGPSPRTAAPFALAPTASRRRRARPRPSRPGRQAVITPPPCRRSKVIMSPAIMLMPWR